MPVDRVHLLQDGSNTRAAIWWTESAGYEDVERGVEVVEGRLDFLEFVETRR